VPVQPRCPLVDVAARLAGSPVAGQDPALQGSTPRLDCTSPLSSTFPGKEGAVIVVQQTNSLKLFAEAMCEQHDSFAQRLRSFEEAFGSVGRDGRALLAQAAYFCWFHGEYQGNLLSTCRAIGSGRASHLYLCGQVTPTRWSTINTYVVGGQRWLGGAPGSPTLLDASQLAQIATWLGERSPAREGLIRLFLCQLVDHLVLRTTFAVLTEGPAPESAGYADFSPWYLRPDGLRYGIPITGDAWLGEGETSRHDTADDALPALCPGSVQAWPFGIPGDEDFVEESKAAVREELADHPEDAEELIEGVLRPSQPPGMHRFGHYQDIKLSSIGALKWRGALPADDESGTRWRGFWNAAEAGLQAWMEGSPPAGDIAAGIHEALGDATEQRRAVVRDFLLQPPPGSGCFEWLLRQAHQDGATQIGALARAMDAPPVAGNL